MTTTYKKGYRVVKIDSETGYQQFEAEYLSESKAEEKHVALLATAQSVHEEFGYELPVYRIIKVIPAREVTHILENAKQGEEEVFGLKVRCLSNPNRLQKDWKYQVLQNRAWTPPLCERDVRRVLEAINL